MTLVDNGVESINLLGGGTLGELFVPVMRHNLATNDLGSQDVARRTGVGEAGSSSHRLVAVRRTGRRRRSYSSISRPVAVGIGGRIALPDGIALSETHSGPSDDAGGRFNIKVRAKVTIVRRPSGLLNEGIIGIGISDGEQSWIGLLGNGAVDLNAIARSSGRIDVRIVLLTQKLGISIQIEGLVEVHRTTRI